eukprot:CAMPEP_0179045546 /NCGR_PEP_ID=MMETSP0796-20121207/18232_1 /TAXON_ID=73915 /ORGANISM="Pyrodinium bahamense, Strain pbaha01" /LENGTH=100 /DNA_ID=CAMNT_0020741953 /DNA_START=377 /DNA_END=674 /DNA_ORIENTATION=+
MSSAHPMPMALASVRNSCCASAGLAHHEATTALAERVHGDLEGLLALLHGEERGHLAEAQDLAHRAMRQAQAEGGHALEERRHDELFGADGGQLLGERPR